MKKEHRKRHKRRALSTETTSTPTSFIRSIPYNMNFSTDKYESVGERGAYRNAVLAAEAARDTISSP